MEFVRGTILTSESRGADAIRDGMENSEIAGLVYPFYRSDGPGQLNNLGMQTGQIVALTQLAWPMAKLDGSPASTKLKSEQQVGWIAEKEYVMAVDIIATWPVGKRCADRAYPLTAGDSQMALASSVSMECCR
jgi:hypothetical protein